MKGQTVVLLAGAGVLAAVVAAFLFAQHPKALPPAFPPAANPYPTAIYAQGIVESDQASGENINLNPEVSGPIVQVFAHEGQAVHAGDRLVALDDSVQRATTEQQARQAEAARTLLAELKAQPRPETLKVAEAQAVQADAAARLAEDQFAKQRQAAQLDARAVSKEALDTAANNARVMAAAAAVAARQLALTKAGAWSYDIRNQERQAEALASAYGASKALLGKYVLHAPSDGVVLAMNAPVGGYVSAQGVYNTYTQGQGPVVVLGAARGQLQVRCFVDEILLQQLPPGDHMIASMTLHGSKARIPLTFVRIQPYLTPKIELSDQRQERVDLRVLPVIFRFDRPKGLNVYPGQVADVFIGRR